MTAAGLCVRLTSGRCVCIYNKDDEKEKSDDTTQKCGVKYRYTQTKIHVSYKYTIVGYGGIYCMSIDAACAHT